MDRLLQNSNIYLLGIKDKILIVPLLSKRRSDLNVCVQIYKWQIAFILLLASVMWMNESVFESLLPRVDTRTRIVEWLEAGISFQMWQLPLQTLLEMFLAESLICSFQVNWDFIMTLRPSWQLCYELKSEPFQFFYLYRDNLNPYSYMMCKHIQTLWISSFLM